jgi:membrane-associated phospholipid phosphatase
VAARCSLATATLIAVALVPVAARAGTSPSELKVRWALDGSITAAALVGTGLVALIPVDRTSRWKTQLLPFDRHLEGRSSASAAETSNVLIAVDVLMPLGLLLGQTGMGEAYGKRSLVYGETIMVGLFLNGVTKYLVGRPRPYTYSDDPRVQAYAEEQGKDSHLSFYSGHSSTAFAAAVAGAYLFAQNTSDRRARAAVWGFGLTLAGATANLRTRAGKHFYSDVILGAVIGAAVGYAVPRLHGGPKVELGTAEWVAIAGAPVLGVVVAQLLPARADVREPLPALVVPWVAPSGGGLMVARVF